VAILFPTSNYNPIFPNNTTGMSDSDGGKKQALSEAMELFKKKQQEALKKSTLQESRT